MDRMVQLELVWTKIALFMSVEDLGLMEVASSAFRRLYAADAYKVRRYDESVAYLTYKTRYGQDGEPLTDKQHCVDLASKRSNTFVIVGGGYGSEGKPGHVFELSEEALSNARGALLGITTSTETTLADVCQHKETFASKLHEIGCRAAASDAFGGMQMYGGFDEDVERATELVNMAPGHTLVPLPKRLSYAASTTMKDGSVLVTGGGAGPYRGSGVYKGCYLKTVEKQREFEVEITGSDLPVRTIPNWSKWQHFLGHHLELFTHPSLSQQTQSELVVSNIIPLRHSIATLIYINSIAQDSSDDEGGGAGNRRWLNTLMYDINDFHADISESLNDIDNDDDDGNDFHAQYGMYETEAFERNINKLVNVVWGGGPAGPVVPDMLQRRCGHSLVTTFDDQVLAMGGYGGGTIYHNSVEILDAERGWHLLQPMRSKRSGFAAAVGMGGRVLVAGGSEDGETPLRTVEALDPREGSWSKLASMNQRRGYSSGTMGPKGRFLVSGGMRNSTFSVDNTMEIYDQRMDQWLLLKPGEGEDSKEEEYDSSFNHAEVFRRTCHHIAYLYPSH